MKASIFKNFTYGLILGIYLISFCAKAGRDFESDYTNQIHGYMPIIQSIGAVIVKMGDKEPYVAQDFDSRTSPAIGDTVYVPVDVIENLKEKFKEAYFDGSFIVEDMDGDKADEPEMALKVEWILFEDLKNYKVVKTVISNPDRIINKFGVGYTVQHEDLGKYLSFRITPITKTGLPREGETLEVKDISKLSGQMYEPINGKIEPASKIIKNTNKEREEHPHIGEGKVKAVDNQEEYTLTIYYKKIEGDGEWVEKAVFANSRLFVNTNYFVKIYKNIRDENGDIIKYEDVTEVYENNIVWELLLERENGELEVVARTGLSGHAKGNVSRLVYQGDFSPIIPKGTDLTMKLSKGTSQFYTQTQNSTALYQQEPHYSEQGLTIGALLVLDDKE